MFNFPAATPLALLVLGASIAGCASTGSGSGATPPATPPVATPKPAPAPAPAALPVLKVFSAEGAQAPYTLFLGTPANFSTTVPQNGLGALDAGAIKVQPATVGSSPGARFTWTGGLGQFHLQSKTANDLLDYLDVHGALVFDTVVHKAPDDQVTLRVDCRYPCLGLVDMTSFFKTAPLDKTLKVKIPLRCFEATGTRFTAVNTPLVVFTTKPFALSVANVSYVPGAAQDADAIPCAAAG